jgi:hypothetical protein
MTLLLVFMVILVAIIYIAGGLYFFSKYNGIFVLDRGFDRIGDWWISWFGEGTTSLFAYFFVWFYGYVATLLVTVTLFTAFWPFVVF